MSRSAVSIIVFGIYLAIFFCRTIYIRLPTLFFVLTFMLSGLVGPIIVLF